MSYHDDHNVSLSEPQYNAPDGVVMPAEFAELFESIGADGFALNVFLRRKMELTVVIAMCLAQGLSGSKSRKL